MNEGVIHEAEALMVGCLCGVDSETNQLQPSLIAKILAGGESVEMHS